MTNNYTTEIFVSVDIEADGPSPGPNSMLSFAAVALDIDRNNFGEFERNLMVLDGAQQNKKTMTEFWANFPEMYEATRQNMVHPNQAMEEFKKWLNGLRKHGIPIFVAYPLGFDYKFIDWYMNKFLGKNAFGISGIDMKSFAMAMLGTNFKETNKGSFPKRWRPKNMPHTHLAIDDAKEQGQVFINMLRENRGLPL